MRHAFGFVVPAGEGRRLDPGPGWSVLLQVTGRQTDGAHALAEVRLASGATAGDPVVWDATDVTVVVRSGRLRVRLGGEHRTAGEGDVVHAARGYPVGLANPFEEPTVLTVLLSPAGAEQLWVVLDGTGDARRRPSASLLAAHGAAVAPPVTDPWDRD